MKTLIFSDTHLSKKFEEKKFNFLKSLINSVDQVIINGDFWEAYEITFDQFLDSPWKNLFPILKKKNTIYIYGNHDPKRFSDERVSLFSVEQKNQHELKLHSYSLWIEHGNRLCPFWEENYPNLSVPSWYIGVMDRVEKTLFQMFGKQFYRIISTRFNQRIKSRLNGELKNGHYFVCGHTHLTEFDKEKRFINTGIIKHGIAQYLIVENDEIVLKEERYY